MDVFHVATEFRFDIGHAVLASETLQEKVQGISQAADDALLSFQHLGAGIVGTLGLGTGGILGTLYKAVQVSDKFNSSALSFANTISANMQFLEGSIHSFNERLDVSRVILKDIANVANKFSLDEGALLGMTKMLAPVMVPHGAAGTNFSNAIDLSRNVLKASPSLGLDPNEIQGQLVRAMLGQASMQDTLFRRLMSETQAFAGVGGGKSGSHNSGSAGFNALTFDKRLKMLHDGLNQFASDMDVINGNAMTLTGTMQRIKNLIGGLNSILKPLGDAILPPLTMLLHEVGDALDKKFRPVIANLSKTLKGLLADPKALLVNVMQLKSLGSDVKKGSELFGFITMISFAGEILRFLGIQAAFLITPLRFLAGALLSISRMIPWMAVFGFAARALWFALSTLAVPLLAVVSLFQILSRAKAIAKVTDAQNLLNMAPQLSVLFARFSQAVSNILFPFQLLFDYIANLIAPLFQVTTWLGYAMPFLDKFAGLLEFIGKVAVLATAGFMGLSEALATIIYNILNFQNPMKDVRSNMNKAMDDFLEKNGMRLGEPGGAVVNQVTNIGKVEIRNDFKETQEPDRVAFTVKEQLMKAARNPRQGRGTGLQNAFAR